MLINRNYLLQCDPTDPHSCCNEINICRDISKNVFRCVLNEKGINFIIPLFKNLSKSLI